MLYCVTNSDFFIKKPLYSRATNKMTALSMTRYADMRFWKYFWMTVAPAVLTFYLLKLLPHGTMPTVSKILYAGNLNIPEYCNIPNIAISPTIWLYNRNVLL